MLLKFAFAQLGMVAHICNLRGVGEMITYFLYSITLSYSYTDTYTHMNMNAYTHACMFEHLYANTHTQ